MRTITQELSLRFKSMSFLCALMVVIIHSASNLGVPNEWIAVAVRDGVCRVAVPFFFFASGFFLVGHIEEKHWWRKAVVSRCSSLLIPYMVFNVAYWILRYVTMGNLGFSFHDIFCALGFSPTCHPVCQPLWYVRALFILVLCSPVVLWLMAVLDRKLFTGSFLFFVFLLYGWLGAYEGVGGAENIFKKYFALQGLFYMSCGVMFRLGKIDVILRGRWQQVAVLFVGVGLMTAKVFSMLGGLVVCLFWLAFCSVSLDCCFQFTSDKSTASNDSGMCVPNLLDAYLCFKSNELGRQGTWNILRRQLLGLDYGRNVML